MTEDKPRAAEIDKLIAAVLEHSKTAIEDIDHDYTDDLKLNDEYDLIKKNHFWAKPALKRLSPSDDNDAGFQDLDSPHLPLSLRYDRERYIFGKYATDDEKRIFIQNQREAVSTLKDELLLCGEDSVDIISSLRGMEKNRYLSDVRGNPKGAPNVLFAHIWKHREDFYSNTHLRFMTCFPEVMSMVFEENKEKINNATEFHNVLARYLEDEYGVDLNPGKVAMMISDYCQEDFEKIQVRLKPKAVQSRAAARNKIQMPERMASDISDGTPSDDVGGAIEEIFKQRAGYARGKKGSGTDWSGQTHGSKKPRPGSGSGR